MSFRLRIGNFRSASTSLGLLSSFYEGTDNTLQQIRWRRSQDRGEAEPDELFLLWMKPQEC